MGGILEIRDMVFLPGQIDTAGPTRPGAGEGPGVVAKQGLGAGPGAGPDAGQGAGPGAAGQAPVPDLVPGVGASVLGRRRLTCHSMQLTMNMQMHYITGREWLLKECVLKCRSLRFWG